MPAGLSASDQVASSPSSKGKNRLRSDTKAVADVIFHFRDSVYVAASNVVKNRLVADDLFVYKVNDSSVALSPQSDRKLDPCEIIGLLMLIYKGTSVF